MLVGRLTNPILEEYQKAINKGRRVFGVILHEEELPSLDRLGFNDYEKEPTGDGRFYVRVEIHTD